MLPATHVWLTGVIDRALDLRLRLLAVPLSNSNIGPVV